MKLYLDENLSPRLAEMLRARGLEVVSAYEVGNAELDDRAQFAYTTREERAIVTATSLTSPCWRRTPSPLSMPA